MLYDYGTTYNLNANTTDPVNSHVYLSRMTTGTNAVNATITNPVIAYVEDNDTTREFTHITSVNTIPITHRVYVRQVALGNGTGTASIFLDNQFDVQLSTFEATPKGIKKIADDSYYIYHVETEAVGSEEILHFMRCAAGSGGATDSILFTLDKTGDFDHVTGDQVIASGRRIYVTYYGYDDVTVPYTTNVRQNRTYYVYMLDMDSESVSLVFSFSLPNSDTGAGEVNQRDEFNITSHLGDLVTYLTYDVTVYDLFYPYDKLSSITYMIKDGGGNVQLIERDPYDDFGATAFYKFVYNYRDSILAWSLDMLSTADTYYVVLNPATGMVSVKLNDTSDFPDIVTPVNFSSLAMYPRISYNAGSYYWLDEKGKVDVIVGATGITVLYKVYPTLDTVNGGIYMSGNTSGNKLFLVDPNTRTVINSWVLPSFPFTTSDLGTELNHGNFFVTRVDASANRRLSYIADVPPLVVGGANQVQIIELN